MDSFQQSILRNNMGVCCMESGDFVKANESLLKALGLVKEAMASYAYQNKQGNPPREQEEVKLQVRAPPLLRTPTVATTIRTKKDPKKKSLFFIDMHEEYPSKKEPRQFCYHLPSSRVYQQLLYTTWLCSITYKPFLPARKKIEVSATMSKGQFDSTNMPMSF
jgi:hypothetical protein